MIIDAAMLRVIITIVGMCFEFGIEAVQKAIVALGKDDITLEDIQKLRDLVKPPESY
jgi:hypothetical protein